MRSTNNKMEGSAFILKTISKQLPDLDAFCYKAIALGLQVST